MAAPIALIAVLDKTGFTLPETADAAMWDFVTYGACWIAGLRPPRRPAGPGPPGWLVAGAAAVLGAAALYWLHGHPGEDGWDLNDVSESQALWSLAVVLLALRWQPPMGWLARIRPLDATVTLLNNRAVTVYLWHNIAIAAVWPILTVLALDDLGRLDGPVDLAVALVADRRGGAGVRLGRGPGGTPAAATVAGHRDAGVAAEPASGRTPRPGRTAAGSALPESVPRLATTTPPRRSSRRHAIAASSVRAAAGGRAGSGFQPGRRRERTDTRAAGRRRALRPPRRRTGSAPRTMAAWRKAATARTGAGPAAA